MHGSDDARSQAMEMKDALYDLRLRLLDGCDPNAELDAVAEDYPNLNPRRIERYFFRQNGKTIHEFRPAQPVEHLPDTDRRRKHFARNWPLRLDIVVAQRRFTWADYDAIRGKALSLSGRYAARFGLRERMLGTPFQIGPDVYIYAGLSVSNYEKPIACLDLDGDIIAMGEEAAAVIRYAYDANCEAEAEFEKREAEKDAERQACRVSGSGGEVGGDRLDAVRSRRARSDFAAIPGRAVMFRG